MKKTNLCNDLNQRIGYWVAYDGDGKKWYEGNYVNGKRDGKWIFYDKDGNTKTSFYNHENEKDIEYCDDAF